jgi:hypothetical protein
MDGEELSLSQVRTKALFSRPFDSKHGRRLQRPQFLPSLLLSRLMQHALNS